MTLYDTFAFFNELDILEIRLTELYPVVDWFVLVEATKTHKGDPKPLYYADNRRRFARWNDKIIHIAVGDLPDGDTQAAIWRREISQRQAIERGLRDVPDDAIVLVSDLDEIPRRESVRYLGEVGLPDDLIIAFDQTLYYYNVNTRCVSPRWRGTRATHAANVRALTPDGVRWEGLKPRSNEYPRHAVFPNAGWHLSYFGDVAHIQTKMRSFLHQELVSDASTDPDTIARRMANGIDVWGREQEQRFAVEAATDLPWAIRSAPHRWGQFFHPDWRPSFTEQWYPPDQAAYIGFLAQHAPAEGAMVEIGCWEGHSAVALAQSIAPRTLICVDHWRGGGEADPDGVVASGARDVYGTFVRNIDLLTPGNVVVQRRDWRDWRETWNEPIAFLHLDAAHDYQSVYDCLVAVKPLLVPNAILCGDDYYGTGVGPAVNDALGDSVHDSGGRLWVWQKET